MNDLPSPARMPSFTVLQQIAEKPANSTELTDNLHTALLDFASHTPDNIACARQIEIGTLGSSTGLKLKNRPVLFSNIAHMLEDTVMPEVFKQSLPDFTPQDWDAFTRLTTLIYLLFGQYHPQPTNRDT